MAFLLRLRSARGLRGVAAFEGYTPRRGSYEVVKQMYAFRPYSHEQDFPRFEAMLNETSPRPVAPAEYLAWREEFPESGINHEVVAVDEGGQVIGYANATLEEPENEHRRFDLLVVVDPAQRGRGLGAGLLAAVESFAREQGATDLTSLLPDHAGAALAFAQRQGYQIDRHNWDSRLELASFDESRFAGLIEGLEAGGIRFLTLAEDREEATLEKLYALQKQNASDFPGRPATFSFMEYDAWQERLFKAHDGHWEQVIIAADGDRLVGLTRLVAEEEEPGVLYTPHTSVDRAYRGRGIALALKLYSVGIARRLGATVMTTSNDALNVPMLAVNRKMGYVAQKGYYQLVKAL